MPSQSGDATDDEIAETLSLGYQLFHLQQPNVPEAEYRESVTESVRRWLNGLTPEDRAREITWYRREVSELCGKKEGS
jgi:inhibitor of KinA sporulation pathway (predicted exonuclease)